MCSCVPSVASVSLRRRATVSLKPITVSLKPVTVYQHVKERLVVVRRCKGKGIFLPVKETKSIDYRCTTNYNFLQPVHNFSYNYGHKKKEPTCVDSLFSSVMLRYSTYLSIPIRFRFVVDTTVA